MEKSVIIEKLTAIFHVIFNDNSIVLRDDMTAADVENWDSLTNMLMMANVEKAFNIKFKLREMNAIKNVSNLIDMIVAKTNE